MPTELFANSASTTLSGNGGSITAGATSLSVASSAAFPAASSSARTQFRALIDSEVVLVTNVSGTTWTVVRNVDGTTAASHNDGATVAAVITRDGLYNNAVHGLGTPLPRDHGWLAENYAGMMCQTSLGPTSAAIYLLRVPVPTTMTISNILLYVQTAGSGLTSGRNFVGLYDSAGNRLGVSADQTTAWASTGTPMTIPLTSPVTVTGGPDVWVYVAVLATGTTPPLLQALSNNSGAKSLLNAGMATAALYFCSNGTGTSLPSTLTLSSNSASTSSPAPWWVALS